MPDHERRYNVLFLCTGNSARSVFGECLINRWSAGRFIGYSAGSDPRGKVHPLAIHELEMNGYLTAGLRSKSWDEFASPDAPQMDFVFTVCDNAAHESCPVWPGQPMTAHWAIADPAAVEGGEIIRKTAFATAFRELQHRVSIFTSLPIKSLSALTLQQRLDEIGRATTSAPTHTGGAS